MHIALRFAYDGSLFQAYARDPALRTVEGCLIEALKREGLVDGSFRTGSRTDAGVSAVENVIMCQVDRKLRGLVPSLQAHLPIGIWATGATEVEPGFKPRYHADRTYDYVIPERGEDLTRMKQACAVFVGRHDMRAFARLEDHRDPMRDILKFQVNHGWRFTVTSPGFLWNQVRRMVDAVLRVGTGQLEVEDIIESLESGTPHAQMKRVPAEGLLLQAVHYKDLEWDPAAGHLDPNRMVRGLQAASVRSALMAALADQRSCGKMSTKSG